MNYQNTDLFLLQSVIYGITQELEAEVNNLYNPAVTNILIAVQPVDIQGYGSYTFSIMLDLRMKTSVVNLMQAGSAQQLQNDIVRYRNASCEVRWIEDSKVLRHAGPAFTEATSLTIEQCFPDIRQIGISGILGKMVSLNTQLVSQYLQQAQPSREHIMFSQEEVSFPTGQSMILDHGCFLFENGIRLLIQEWNPDGSFQMTQQLDYVLYRSAKNDGALGRTSNTTAGMYHGGRY